MNPQKRRAIYEKLRAANPHPKPELAFGSPYQLLVAVVLSAQATDKSVNATTAKLFPVAGLALGKTTLLEGVQHSAQRRLRHPRLRGDHARLRLAPDPGDPHDDEGGPRQIGLREDRALHVVAHRVGGAEEVGDD